MYLVSSDKFPLPDGKTEKSEKSPLKKKQHPYDKWARFLEKIAIAENTTLSNWKQEKKKKSRKLPLKKKQQHPNDKWVRFCERIRESYIKGE